MSLFEAGFNLPPGVSPNDPHFNPPDDVECGDCGGKGTIGGPDEFGNYDPCDVCEGSGLVEQELDEGPDPDDLRDQQWDRDHC